MSVEISGGAAALAEFVVAGIPPAAARQRAAAAICDTAGVILAGATESAARIVQRMVAEESHGECRVLGTPGTAGPVGAALANGVAAHALDFDDMCFVSLAHPSCALVPAILAAGDIDGAPGQAVLDAYVIGFELECRLGNVMNPRHYHERGWHCTGRSAPRPRRRAYSDSAPIRRVSRWESRRPPRAASRRTWAAWSSRFMPAWPPETV